MNHDDLLSEYLAQDCDDCDRTAVYNGVSTETGKRGKFCTSHTSFLHPSFARDD